MGRLLIVATAGAILLFVACRDDATGPLPTTGAIAPIIVLVERDSAKPRAVVVLPRDVSPPRPTREPQRPPTELADPQASRDAPPRDARPVDHVVDDDPPRQLEDDSVESGVRQTPLSPHGHLDEVRATATSGSFTRSITLSLNPSTNRFEGQIDGVPPGTYAVRIEGLVSSQIDFFGIIPSVSVTAGQTARPTIQFEDFSPNVTQAPTDTAAFSFGVTYEAVNSATSYVVEWDDDPGFGSPDNLTSTQTSTTISVPGPGAYSVRVRATNTVVGGSGRPGDATTVDVIEDAQPSDPGLAPSLGFAPSVTLQNLNISPQGDRDVFALDACAEDVITAEMRAERLDPPSNLNGYVRIYDAAETEVASNDDHDPGSGLTLDPRVDYIVPASGRYVIEASAVGDAGTGHYELDVTVTPGNQNTGSACQSLADPATSTITADPARISADGSSASTITVQLKDASGANLTTGGDAVILSTTLGTLSAVNDNADGTYTATLTAGITPGTAVVSGELNGVAMTATADVELTALDYSGSWAGTTSQSSRPISFEIESNGITTISFEWAVSACGATGTTTTNFGTPIDVSGGSFTQTVAGSPLSYTISGTFTSATAASGTLTLNYSQAGVCSSNVSGITWGATRATAVADPATSTITASPTSIPADGSSTSTITVQLKDAGGANLTTGGHAVTLATTLGTLSGVTDNGDGTYTATLTAGTTAGLAEISGTVNGAPIADGETVTLTNPGSTADPTTSTIAAGPTSIPADGASTSTITVQLKDASGANVTTGGDAVALSTTLGSLSAVTDNGDGTYAATLTAGTASGTATISGTLNGIAMSSTADVTLTAVADPATSTITASPTSIPADGSSTSTLTVQLKEPDGTNLTTGGDAVTLATTLGALSGVIDNGDGTYTATLTAGTTAGLAEISGTVNGAPIADGETVTLTNPGSTADPTTSTITAGPTSIPADGASTSTITVQLKDASGTNLTTGGDAVALSTTLGTLSAVTDNGDGTYTATLTAGTTVGQADVSGQLNAVGMTSTASVTLTCPSQAIALHSTVTGDLETTDCDAPHRSGSYADLYTFSGVAGQLVNIRMRAAFDTYVFLVDVDGSTIVTFDDDCPELSDGLNSCILGTELPNTGTYTIEATSFSSGSTGPYTVILSAPPSAATSTITASPTSIPADGSSTSTISVQLKDAVGNNLHVGGDVVDLTTTLGTLSAVTDNGDGTYTATLTAGTTAGPADVNGTVNGAAIADGETVTFTNPGSTADPATSTITANPTSIPADGSSTSTITVQLKDASGTNLTTGGDAVALSTTLGTLSAVTDIGDGTYTATLTAGTSGTATISGTLNSVAMSSTADVTLTAVADPGTSTITANPTSIPADGSSTSTITVQLKEPDGGNLTTGGDAVTLATTLGTLSAVTDNGDGTYTATLTAGTVVGTATISGTVNGTGMSSTVDVTFANPGSTADPTTSTITAGPTSIRADGFSTSTITVQAKDASGTNLTTGGDAVALSTTLGSLSGVTDNLDGTYSATLTAGATPGEATISGTLNGAPMSFTVSVALTGSFSVGVVYPPSGNGGNEATRAIFDAGLILGTVTDVAAANFDAMTPEELRAAFDVLVFAWANDGAPVDFNADWTTRLLPFLQLGGGIYWEDPNNVGDLAPQVTGEGYETSSVGYTITATVPGLTDGLGTTFVNGHTRFTAWDASLAPFLTYTDGAGTHTVGLSGAIGTGCIVLTGPDQDYHALDGGVTGQQNMYDFLINIINWAADCSATSSGADPATSTITADPASIPADGTSPSNITVQLKDAGGTNLTAGGDVVTLSATTGTLSPVTDNGDGTYGSILTAGTTVEKATITGTVNSAAIADDATVDMTGSLATAAPNNGLPTNGAGIFVDLTATLGDLVVTEIGMVSSASEGVPVRLRIWRRDGSYVGNGGSSTGWSVVDQIDATSAVTETPTTFVLNNPISLTEGIVTGFFFEGEIGGVRYTGTNINTPQTTWSDANLTLFSDLSEDAPLFAGATFTPRNFSGYITYSCVAGC